MSTSRKISVRRIIQTLVTLVAVSGCMLAFISADKMQTKRSIKDVQILIRNGKLVHFVNDSDIRRALFSNRHIDPKRLSLAKLDIHGMESIARTNPWIADAQVYLDNNQVIHIFLTQRVPAVRVFETDGNSYYLDTALQAMPLSSQYAHYTTVITNIPVLHNDSTSNAIKGRLVWLAQYITHHPFWNAQIAQVVMSDNNSFELIPVMGKQRILIGDTSRLDEKLRNLLVFYKQVQNKIGWDRYRVLDVRFADQVVASPSLPWKAPVDKTLSSMAWVKAIMDAIPKDKTEADPDTAVVALPTPLQVSQQSTVPQKPTVAAKPPKKTITVAKPIDKKKVTSSNKPAGSHDKKPGKHN